MTTDDTRTATTAEEFWDGRYGVADRIWSGRPNAALVREAAGLTPGRALDLGCGEGGDALWLARQGWQVTAVDVSRVALGRAAEHAAEAGLAHRIDLQRHDLAESFPEGTFELVSAQFLHSPVEMPRDAVLRAAAAAVVPGGVLLVVGHAGWPSWATGDEPDVHFPTTAEVLDALALPDGAWEVLTDAEHVQELTDPEGRPGARTDNTLTLRRLPH